MATQLTGVLSADFSDFYSAVNKAEAELKGLESGSAKVESAIGRVGDEGAKDLQKVSNAAKDLTDANNNTQRSTTSLSDTYKQFDGVLSAAGVNIGKEVKALEDLSSAANKSEGSLGGLTKAGLAAGAFMVGWNIGKQINEWTGLDKAIGDTTASLLGWTTAAGGAGSASDTLARATQLAGREVRSLDDALRIIRKSIDDNQAAWSRQTAPAEAAKLVKQYREEIETLRKAGVLDDLKKDLEANVIPQKELGRLYGVSSEALKILGTQLDAHKERVERINAENERFVGLQDKMFGRDLIAKAQEYVRVLGDINNTARLTPEAMAEMNKTFAGAAEQLGRLGQSGTGLQQMFRDLQIATTDWKKVNEDIAKMPDPFAAQLQSRREAFRATQMEQMNLNQGITDSQLYWAHAGEIADESMKQAAAATNETTQAVVQQKSQVDALSGSFTVLVQSASQWREQAARLTEDAARMEQGMKGASTTGWESQYLRNVRGAAQHAEQSAAYEDRITARVAGMTAPWGGSNYSINVNAMQGINGDQVAAELVNGMRRRGVALG